MDQENIMRIGGRLENSKVSYDTKHPIILPSHCQLTKMIIQHVHLTTMHGGTSLTLAYINKYWILGAKNSLVTYSKMHNVH